MPFEEILSLLIDKYISQQATDIYNDDDVDFCCYCDYFKGRSAIMDCQDKDCISGICKKLRKELFKEMWRQNND